MVSRLTFKTSGTAALAFAMAASLWSASPTLADGPYAPAPVVEAGHKTAVFAGGCFWCVESDFDKIPGVVSTTSGYTGGAKVRPSYKEVSYTETGHYEAVAVVYDPKIVSYDALLTAFWHSVDPTDDGGQFCDRGTSYRTAIFATPEQRAKAEASKAAIAQDGWPKKPIVTPILDSAPFYPAEVSHQDYYTKSPIRYLYYRTGCGRDKRIKQVWGPLAFKGIPKS